MQAPPRIRVFVGGADDRPDRAGFLGGQRVRRCNDRGLSLGRLAGI